MSGFSLIKPSSLKAKICLEHSQGVSEGSGSRDDIGAGVGSADEGATPAHQIGAIKLHGETQRMQQPWVAPTLERTHRQARRNLAGGNVNRRVGEKMDDRTLAIGGHAVGCVAQEDLVEGGQQLTSTLGGDGGRTGSDEFEANHPGSRRERVGVVGALVANAPTGVASKAPTTPTRSRQRRAWSA